MADEITILNSNGSFRFSLLLLFPIDTPAVAGGANVVPTPASDLPALGSQILVTAETDALDAGTSAFKVVQFRKDATLTTPQLTAVVRDLYARELSAFNQRYTQTYLHVGTRIDE